MNDINSEFHFNNSQGLSKSALDDTPPLLRHRCRCSEFEDLKTNCCIVNRDNPTVLDDDKTTRCIKNNICSDLFKRKWHKPRCSQNTLKNASGFCQSLFSLLGFELTRGYSLEGNYSQFEQRRKRVYTFLYAPFEMEKFCIFGVLQCIDTFLYFWAFLPIRSAIALFRLIFYPCIFLLSRKQHHILQPVQVCDILKGMLMVLVFIIVNYIDTSRLYHLVRGQAVIKLYIFYNMMDLADRVLSGAGQDVLDALYWTAVEPVHKHRWFINLVMHFILALIYIFVHAVLMLAQSTVLNVAFNSHNKALLTIMMSNNFVEIKGSLFKRIDRNNLLRISCSDVRERFHLSALLFIVFVRNMTEFNWNYEHIEGMAQDAMIVIAAEVVVDWVKHAFITKFNEISAETYRTFKINLVQDILASQDDYAYTDYSDQVCRRLGFTPIPLICVLAQLYSKSVHVPGIFTFILLAIFFLCTLVLCGTFFTESYAISDISFHKMPTIIPDILFQCVHTLFIGVAFILVHLVTAKICTSIILLGWACRLLEEEQEEGNQVNLNTISSQVLVQKESSRNDATLNDGTLDKNNHMKHPTGKYNASPAISPNVDLSNGTVDSRGLYKQGNSSQSPMHQESDTSVSKQSQCLKIAATPLEDVDVTHAPNLMIKADGGNKINSECSDCGQNSLDITCTVRGSHESQNVEFIEDKKYK